ncbi:MAG TPA: hypothetical protein PLH36_05205 [Armatimonadota bacterium]|nr:hypothetical protein [Armatimonadota bacterium]
MPEASQAFRLAEYGCRMARSAIPAPGVLVNRRLPGGRDDAERMVPPEMVRRWS